MLALSSRFQTIGESQTVALTALAAQLKRDGKDIISLGAGEPDFATPSHVARAGIEAIESGTTKYTAVHGLFELRQAIADWIEQQYHATYSAENIVITCGAKHAVYQSILALCEPGDEIIVPAPYWVSYPEQIALAGGMTKIILPTQQNLKITPDELAAAITEKTKALILNSPSNPSGALYSKEELAALVPVIRKSGIAVISDEIYDQIVFDGHVYASLAEFEEIRHQLIYINGASKSFAMTGWRIGFLAAPLHIATAVKKYQGHSTTNPCTISQYAALHAYRAEKDFVKGMVDAYQQRRNYVMQRLQTWENVSCMSPQGTFYAFPDLSAYYKRDKGIHNSVELCTYLIKNVGVVLVPGAAFGLDNHVRLSFATSTDMLERALDRIETGLQSLQE